MKVLLDTHLLLWAAGDPARLPQAARDILEAPENEFLFSAASLWEVVIKAGLGREDLQMDPSTLRRGLLDNGYGELPVDSRHTVAVAGLPHEVPQSVIRRRFQAGWLNFSGLYKQVVDEWALYDNSGPTPQILEEGVNT